MIFDVWSQLKRDLLLLHDINMKSFKDPSVPRFYKEAEGKMKTATLACGAPGLQEESMWVHANHWWSPHLPFNLFTCLSPIPSQHIPTCWLILQASTFSARSQGARRQWLQKWKRGAKLPWGGHKLFHYMHARSMDISESIFSSSVWLLASLGWTILWKKVFSWPLPEISLVPGA